MEQFDQIVSSIALTMGAAWASGINLYAAILMLGVLGATGNINLPLDLQVLTNPIIIIAAGLMYLVEFFADKIPGIDTGWDAIEITGPAPQNLIISCRPEEIRSMPTRIITPLTVVLINTCFISPYSFNSLGRGVLTILDPGV